MVEEQNPFYFLRSRKFTEPEQCLQMSSHIKNEDSDSLRTSLEERSTSYSSKGFSIRELPEPFMGYGDEDITEWIDMFETVTSLMKMDQDLKFLALKACMKGKAKKVALSHIAKD